MEEGLNDMSLLREYISMILAEAALGPNDLPDGHRVVVKNTPRKKIELQIVDENDRSIGELRAYKNLTRGNCHNAYFVGWASASGGWGPMLYDIAMEIATEDGSSLMADRSDVSPEALRVWDFYLSDRSDVEAIQLDDLNDLLTDEEKDNCEQESFDEKLWDDFPSLINQTKELRNKIRKNKFLDSSLTKTYRKKNRVVLDTLEKMQAVEYT